MHWYRFICLLIAIAMTAIAPPVQSSEISGSETEAFTNAVETWLAGDDLAALRSLAQLSREGNTAAQILLASIGKRGLLHSHVTANLSRKERIELLRIPQGLSGKSWLTEAQKTEPLAVALLQSARIGEKGPAIGVLLDSGEPTLALLETLSMLQNGNATELLQILEDRQKQLPEESIVILVWTLQSVAIENNGRYVGSGNIPIPIEKDARFIQHGLLWSTPRPKDLVENAELQKMVSDTAESVKHWTPLKAFCEANCGSSVPTCMMVAAAALSPAGAFPMRSPIESLIPHSVYWNSPRVTADLARQSDDVKRWSDWEELVQLDACYFEHMGRAQDIYGHAK